MKSQVLIKIYPNGHHINSDFQLNQLIFFLFLLQLDYFKLRIGRVLN
jgi:hypothetical protein